MSHKNHAFRAAIGIAALSCSLVSCGCDKVVAPAAGCEIYVLGYSEDRNYGTTLGIRLVSVGGCRYVVDRHGVATHAANCPNREGHAAALPCAPLAPPYYPEPPPYPPEAVMQELHPTPMPPRDSFNP